ncbi:MAG: hypothetical protein QOH19_638 [Actinomycetota bacterium]|jgi:hypothetical protein|nr:hypothetical protein [Actinomycetota bacterium]
MRAEARLSFVVDPPAEAWTGPPLERTVFRAGVSGPICPGAAGSRTLLVRWGLYQPTAQPRMAWSAEPNTT